MFEACDTVAIVGTWVYDILNYSGRCSRFLPGMYGGPKENGSLLLGVGRTQGYIVKEVLFASSTKNYHTSHNPKGGSSCQPDGHLTKITVAS